MTENGYAMFATDVSCGTLEIAKAVGVVAPLPGYPTVQQLVPREDNHLELSSYSGNFGKSAFPLHTDMAHWFVPPRFFLLRCIRPAEDVYTHLLHARKVFSPEDRDIAQRALFRPRRRLDGRLTLLRLHDDEIFRWDPLFLIPMSPRAIAFQKNLAAKISASMLNEVAFSYAGDSLIVDNWNVLHGRSSVPEGASNRLIERVYLSALKEDNNAKS